MLESIMFFVLGALSAGLISLWLAPLLWRRASRITQKRIEASIPLSMAEIQADKDHMRADFAVQLRRHEIETERLQERGQKDLVEINKQRSRVDALLIDRRKKAEDIQQLEIRLTDSRNETQRKADHATQLGADLRAHQAKLQDRTKRVDQLERAVEKAETNLNSARIELAGSQTKVETLTDKVQNFAEAGKKLTRNNGELKREIASMKSQLQRQKKTQDETLLRAEETMAQFADLEERLERRERELQRLKDESAKRVATESSLADVASDGQQTDSKSSRTSKRIKTTKDTMPTEKSVAPQRKPRSKQRTGKSKVPESETANVTSSAKSNGGPMVEGSLQAERSALEGRLSGFEDKLMARMAENAGVMPQAPDLIGEMNDIAAEITALTARMEGASSPILSLVSSKNTAPAEGSLKTADKPKLKGFKAPAGAASLSQRIAELHKVASDKR